jgi:hypothetical protein
MVKLYPLLVPGVIFSFMLFFHLSFRANVAFNKEVFVDFIAAQIKTLSFLAYIIRIYQEIVNTHAPQMVKGMLGLLTLCPQEAAHLRKELLIAAKHILATDLRNSEYLHGIIYFIIFQSNVDQCAMSCIWGERLTNMPRK